MKLRVEEAHATTRHHRQMTSGPTQRRHHPRTNSREEVRARRRSQHRLQFAQLSAEEKAERNAWLAEMESFDRF